MQVQDINTKLDPKLCAHKCTHWAGLWHLPLSVAACQSTFSWRSGDLQQGGWIAVGWREMGNFGCKAFLHKQKGLAQAAFHPTWEAAADRESGRAPQVCSHTSIFAFNITKVAVNCLLVAQTKLDPEASKEFKTHYHTTGLSVARYARILEILETIILGLAGPQASYLPTADVDACISLFPSAHKEGTKALRIHYSKQLPRLGHIFGPWGLWF